MIAAVALALEVVAKVFGLPAEVAEGEFPLLLPVAVGVLEEASVDEAWLVSPLDPGTPVLDFGDPPVVDDGGTPVVTDEPELVLEVAKTVQVLVPQLVTVSNVVCSSLTVAVFCVAPEAVAVMLDLADEVVCAPPEFSDLVPVEPPLPLLPALEVAEEPSEDVPVVEVAEEPSEDVPVVEVAELVEETVLAVLPETLDKLV